MRANDADFTATIHEHVRSELVAQATTREEQRRGCQKKDLPPAGATNRGAIVFCHHFAGLHMTLDHGRSWQVEVQGHVTLREFLFPHATSFRAASGPDVIVLR